jgi:putative serine protease PepD
MSPVLGRHGQARPGFVLALITTMTVTAATACTSTRHDKTHAATALQRDYEATIARVLPSVVEISAGHSTGSGVVLDQRGDIVTNAHVVGTAKKFEIRISTTSEPMKARLVGVFSPDDLAVIKVMKGAGALKPVQWADSARANVGAIVLAMGSPYGLTDSVTQGIVSATGRTVTGPTIPGQAPTVIVDAVQTSAAINPGNSGGALVLLSGRVLGIPTLSAQDPELGGPAQGIGFAIPANTVLKIGRQLVKNGKVTSSDRASLNFKGETHVNSSGKPDGVTVEAVKPGGAAAGAGIRPGDVIVGVDGKATADIGALESDLIGFRPGDQVKVELLRNGNPREVLATLGSLSS